MSQNLSAVSGASSSEFIRAQWVAASQFHDLTEEQVLREVSRRVTGLRVEAGSGTQRVHPLVLLDLDSTLYEVGPRSFQILQEWKNSSESAEFPQLRQVLDRLHPSQVGYSLRDTFHTLGLSLEETAVAQALKSAKRFWQDRFFTSEYLKYDHAYPGASHFAQELHELGAEIVYLTGRDLPGMGEGTRARLLQDRFPWEVERTHLLMKPAPEMDDLHYKQSAADYIRQHGSLVASFENEPPNLVALYEIFPKAMHVFVDTVQSDRPAPAGRDLYRIRGFSSAQGE